MLHTLDQESSQRLKLILHDDSPLPISTVHSQKPWLCNFLPEGHCLSWSACEREEEPNCEDVQVLIKYRGMIEKLELIQCAAESGEGTLIGIHYL